jgi:hypothetical protein
VNRIRALEFSPWLAFYDAFRLSIGQRSQLPSSPLLHSFSNTWLRLQVVHLLHRSSFRAPWTPSLFIIARQKPVESKYLRIGQWAFPGICHPLLSEMLTYPLPQLSKSRANWPGDTRLLCPWSPWSPGSCSSAQMAHSVASKMPFEKTSLLD